MNVLFLGTSPSPIVEALNGYGCTVISQDGVISLDYLERNKIQFAVSYRYRMMVRKPVIEYLNRRIINLHISFLPWNRGADPNLWSFLDDTPKGVTIHYMDEGLDTGDILIQEEIAYEKSDTLRTAYQKLSRTIETLFRIHWPAIVEGHIVPIRQVGSGSYHTTVDKAPYLHLISNGWDTPVMDLVGKGKMAAEGKV